MRIDKRTVSRLLKKPAASKVMEDNLYAQVGSAKKIVIHFRFYWKEFGERQYRKIGTATADSSTTFLKELDAAYLRMLANYQRGITPKNVELMDQRRDAHEKAVREHQVSVEAVFHQYLDNHLAHLPNAEEQESADLGRYKNHIHPLIGKKAAATLTKKQMQAVVDNVATKAPAQAYYIAEFLKRVWTYAIDVGHDDLDLKCVTRLRRPPKPKRTRVVTPDELRLILRDGDPVIQAMVYMGQRVSDTRKMRWADIEGDWLTITPAYYKTKRYHRVYLTKTVQRLMTESNRKTASSEFSPPLRIPNSQKKRTRIIGIPSVTGP